MLKTLLRSTIFLKLVLWIAPKLWQLIQRRMNNTSR